MDKSKKLDYLQQKRLGPADDLRGELNRLEEAYPVIKSMDRQQVLGLLHGLDQLSLAFAQLELADIDLVAEQVRFDSLQTRLKKKAAKLLAKIGGAESLTQYRADFAPPADHWWWYLDRIVTAQRQHTLKRLGIGGLIVLIILAGLVVLFNTVLKPSPETVARLNAETNAYAAIEQEGDYEKALIALDEGLAAVPNDPSLLVIKGVLLQLLNREAEAENIFLSVQEIIDQPVDYHLARAQVYLRTGQFKQAEEEIKAALELDKKFARSWLMLGQSLEMQDNYFEAMQAYETASDIALDNQENEIYVMSRMALARLIEAAPANQLEQATGEPAEE
jgi:tetratricopeptide (TPR) repeat protein